MILTSRYASVLVLFGALLAITAAADDASPVAPGVLDGQRDVIDAQPQVVRFAATIGGSGRLVFTRGKVFYEHKHWGKPTNIRFDGASWANLESTPAPWTDYSSKLDLTKAWVVKRQGRDVVALEHTPDGFDFYLSDSPNGAAEYEVTIAIPRRK